MGGYLLENEQDIQDLVEGALWMGTGGGGSYQEGFNLLLEVLQEGYQLGWVDPDTVADDLWTVTVGQHGSIAPPPPEIRDEIQRQGLVEAPGDWFLVQAVKELEDALGQTYSCLVPAELGPGSVADSLAAGARLGLPVVDGDYIGRAVPEETQSTYCLHNKHSLKFAAVDPWGNSVFIRKAVNIHAMERIAKMLALASYGLIAVATTPLPARDMKKILVPGTLSKCLRIGQALRQARRNGGDPIAAGIKASGGWQLFSGRVETLNTEDRDGYFFGNVIIAGDGPYRDQTFKVWFKNESLVSWLNDQPWVTSPDLISLVYQENGRGIYNAELQEGDQVAVIGIQGLEGFRTERGLTLAGPGHFGFDIDYHPIEHLVSTEKNQA